MSARECIQIHDCTATRHLECVHVLPTCVRALQKQRRILLLSCALEALETSLTEQWLILQGSNRLVEEFDAVDAAEVETAMSVRLSEQAPQSTFRLWE